MINENRRGKGRLLLLIHGLGVSQRSWDLVLPRLAASRTVIAIDLPGHGASPAEPGSGTFAGLADSVEIYIRDQGLTGIDIVGSSLGARIALELAQRGGVGTVVALDPGGFWTAPWERPFFSTTLSASVGLLRMIRPMLPAICETAPGRTALLAQLSARPWALDPALVADELANIAATPTIDDLIHDLSTCPAQEGPAAKNSGPVIIGWGRDDRLCQPHQAARAMAAFPSARLHWFGNCGHFPMWDQPEETTDLILQATDGLDQLPRVHQAVGV